MSAVAETGWRFGLDESEVNCRNWGGGLPLTEKCIGMYEYVPDVVSPPGSTLLETIEALGMTQAELARRMGRPVKTINEIINGKTAITPETALQLERVLGIPAHFWRNREEQYQQYLLAQRDEKERAEYSYWLEEIPFRYLVTSGWVKDGANDAERVRLGLEYFGVASVDAWRSTWGSPTAVYRRSPVFEAKPGAVAAWLRKGEIEARTIECSPYRKKAFASALQDIRLLTVEQPEVFIPKMQSLCAQTGVAVVFVPEVPESRASGAARWLNRQKALIQLSFRYKTDDQLWFTFFHEAAHVLGGYQSSAFIDNFEPNDLASEVELEADRFAADILVPPTEYRKFTEGIQGGRISRNKVSAFAKSIGVAPGIVVGRLQHDGLLPYTHLNGLKVRLKWPT